jgi:hypothetical protein
VRRHCRRLSIFAALRRDARRPQFLNFLKQFSQVHRALTLLLYQLITIPSSVELPLGMTMIAIGRAIDANDRKRFRAWPPAVTRVK